MSLTADRVVAFDYRLAARATDRLAGLTWPSPCLPGEGGEQREVVGGSGRSPYVAAYTCLNAPVSFLATMPSAR